MERWRLLVYVRRLGISTLLLYGIMAIGSPAAKAQKFLVGIRAGVPVTDYLNSGSPIFHGPAGSRYNPSTYRYVFGAVAEWRASEHLGLEAGVFYHRVAYDVETRAPNCFGPLGCSHYTVRGSAWDFPLVAKFRWGHTVHPFAGAGGVLRYVGPIRQRGESTIGVFTGDPPLLQTTTTPIDSKQPPEIQKRFYPGLTVTSGIEFPIGRAVLTPEFRYTRWLANIGPAGPLKFPSNQAEFLIGLSF